MREWRFVWGKVWKTDGKIEVLKNKHQILSMKAWKMMSPGYNNKKATLGIIVSWGENDRFVKKPSLLLSKLEGAMLQGAQQ